VGECDYQYHGANRLGANSLLSCLYGGLVTGPAIATYRNSLSRSAFDLPGSVFDKAEVAQQTAYDDLLSGTPAEGEGENPFHLHDALGEVMLRECTTERTDAGLDAALEKIEQLRDRSTRIEILDRASALNQTAQLARQLDHMLVLARIVAAGARRRQECRGAHYKPELDPERQPGAPGRDDAQWLRTTLARRGEHDQVVFLDGFTYECAGKTVNVTDTVNTSVVAPRARSYARAGATHGDATAEERE
jgi:succinate dehydrogenase / fumarate reductase flavoprotein subunit